MGWGDNGSTGARSAAVGRAAGYGLLSKAVGAVGAGFSFGQSGYAFSQGKKAEGAKSALDGGMALVGAFGGPWGAGVSGVYFALDLVGWKNCQDALNTQCDRDCRRK
jgi:hypothetical protein